jgi:uncharacterized protein (DUF433 family)
MTDNYEASARGCYGAARAAALAGVPRTTVYYWARTGVVVPSVSSVREKLWSYQDLLTLRAAYWLRQRKGQQPASPMREVRMALRQTVDEGLDLWSDDSVMIRVDLAGRVFVDRSDGSRSTVDGQAAWDMGDTIDLLSAIGDRPGLVRPTRHVRIAPARLAGEPFLLDTRIGTQGLASLASDGYDVAMIAGLYGLPLDHVDEALQYEWALVA